MWGCCYVQVFALHLDTQVDIAVGEIADCDDDLLTVAEYDNWRLAVFPSCVGYHFCSWSNKLAEMLVGVVFGGIAFLARLAVYLNEGVLRPAPC